MFLPMPGRGVSATGRRRAAFAAGLALLLVGASATTATADTVLSQQWHLDVMKAEEMWRTSTGEGVTVALIDTGVREVPELAGQLRGGKDFTDGASGKQNESGTVAAAVIAGTGKGRDGKESAFGLAPGAKILPLKVSNGSEAPDSLLRPVAMNRDLAPAIRYAADSEAKIISISVNVITENESIHEAVDYALAKGKLVFASVGDSESQSERPVQHPATTPGVVGVAPVGKNLAALPKATSGHQVDFSAPGEDVLSACTEAAGLCRSSGSTVATAIASASAALIWAAHPDWTSHQVLRVMLNTIGGPTSGAVRGDYIGYGIVRPRIALKTPGDPGPADTYPLPGYTVPSAPQDDEGVSAASAAGNDRSTAFLVSASVCAAGLLSLAVAVPLLLVDRRRVRLSRP
ncbi:S8 family serine peptidase [Kitasatospora cinereorecta]